MSLFLATLIATVTTKVQLPPPGGDTDRFGCIPSAGYLWCDAKQKCYRPWEESCAATTHTPTTTTYTPAAPNCAGFLNCVAYNDGCNSCKCGDGGTLCTTKFCGPELGRHVRRCTACTDGYVLNPITNECKPSASCCGFAHCYEYSSGYNMCACWGYTVGGIYYPGEPHWAAGLPDPNNINYLPKLSPPHCTVCIDGYALDKESNECVRVMDICINPCEQFNRGINVNGDQWFAHCEGHPNTRCEGLADRNRGCLATYFDSVTSEEIVDCVLIWEVLSYPYTYGITTM